MDSVMCSEEAIKMKTGNTNMERTCASSMRLRRTRPLRETDRLEHRRDRSDWDADTRCDQTKRPRPLCRLVTIFSPRCSLLAFLFAASLQINFARQGDRVPGVFHVNKRVMGHSHVIETMGNVSMGMGAAASAILSGAGGAAAAASAQQHQMAAHQQAHAAQQAQMASQMNAMAAMAGMPGMNMTPAAIQAMMSAFPMGPMGAMGSMGMPPSMHQALASPPAPTSSTMGGSAAGSRQTALTSLLRGENQDAMADAVSITEQPNVISAGCDQLKSSLTCITARRAINKELSESLWTRSLIFCFACVCLFAGVELLRAFRECDAQLFNGYSSHAGLYDEPSIKSSLQLVEAVSKLIAARVENKAASARVIVSGCGTSGRIGWNVCSMLNSVLAKLNHPELFYYMQAGGDRGLVLSESDLPEDDAERGRRELQKAMEGQEQVVFIGISSGLSAPYVAGQVDYALDLQATIKAPASMHVALIGFTPPSRARDVAIERWDSTAPAGATVHTFKQVVRRMEQMSSGVAAGIKKSKSDASSSAAASGSAGNPNVTLLTPIVGPEFVTGSTRLKAASATTILLESIFATAFAKSFVPAVALTSGVALGAGGENVRAAYLSCLQQFESVFRQTYLQIQSLAPVLDMAAASLAPAPKDSAAGRLLYVSFSASAGRMALVDSSEINDTFGNGFEAVRSFMVGGMRKGVRDPESLDAKAPAANGAAAASSSSAAASAAAGKTVFNVSLSDFKLLVPSLTAKDTVVVLLDAEAEVTNSPAKGTEDQGWTVAQDMELMQLAKARGAKVALIQLVSPPLLSQKNKSPVAAVMTKLLSDGVFDTAVRVPFNTQGVLSQVDRESSLLGFSWKLILNALSTGAHIQNGFVLGNRMVNLSVTNLKLYNRAIALITELTQVTPEVAEKQLLRAIYQTDVITEEMRTAKVSDDWLCTAESGCGSTAERV